MALISSPSKDPLNSTYTLHHKYRKTSQVSEGGLPDLFREGCHFLAFDFIKYILSTVNAHARDRCRAGAKREEIS